MQAITKYGLKYTLILVAVIGLFTMAHSAKAATCASGNNLSLDQFNQAKSSGSITYRPTNSYPGVNSNVQINITNNTDCGLPVSVATYKQFVHNYVDLPNQYLFNTSGVVTIAPHSQGLISASTPSCAFQWDIWYGQSADPIASYDTRTLWFGVFDSSIPVCQTPQVLTPTVDLKANGSDGPITIPSGQTVNLTWTATNVTSCVASGAWGGVKGNTGSEQSQPLTITRTFSLLCVNSTAQSVFDSVTVNVTQPPQPPTVNLKANGFDGPITIVAGNQAVLSWTSTNAATCSASGGPWSGTKSLNSSEVTNSLNQNTTFSITCSNAAGQIAYDSVTINVQQQPQPPTVDIKANGSNGPITIMRNTQATLSWVSQNATSCFASGGPWTGPKNLNSSEITVSLTQNTIFSITCVNSIGQSDIDSVTINLQDSQQPPVVDIKANASDGPITIDYLQSATLSWTSSNADSCVASGFWNGSKPLNSSQTTGSLIAGNYMYTLTCTNSVGQDVDSVTVNVRNQQSNQPTVDIKANGSDGPITIDYLSSANLSWTSTDADSCVASGSWSGSKGLNSNQSTGTLTAGTYSFAIQCTGAGGVANDAVTVIVRSQQIGLPTAVLSANPSSITSGNRSTLSWTSGNADQCFADGGPWSGGKSVGSGSEQTGVLTQSTNYRITCTNSAGSASADAYVTVSAGSISVTLTANPSTVNQGGSTTLIWTSQNATTCYADGGNWSGAGKSANSSEVVNNVNSTQTFGITCTNNSGGSAHATALVTVTQNNLTPFVSINASPNPVISGNQSTLSWYSTNATTCYASGGPWSGPKNLNYSEVTISLTQSTNFAITCQSSSGQIASANVTVGVTSAPVYTPPTYVPPPVYYPPQVLGVAAPTLTIYANPASVQYGYGTTLYWTATNVDTCYASNDWYGSKAISGSQPTGTLFSPKTYTLTCYGQGGSIVRSAVVPVVGGPIVYTPTYVPPPSVAGASTGVYAVSITKQGLNYTVPNGNGVTLGAWSGNELGYGITVTNTGTLNLNNLVVKDRLSSKVEIVSASDNGTYDYVTRTVTWKVSRIAPGATKVIYVRVKVIDSCQTDTTIENVASVDNGAIDETTSNLVLAGPAYGNNANNGASVIGAVATSSEATSTSILHLLPGTFVGWLLLLLLIIILALLIKRLLSKDEEKKSATH